VASLIFGRGRGPRVWCIDGRPQGRLHSGVATA